MIRNVFNLVCVELLFEIINEREGWFFFVICFYIIYIYLIKNKL